MDINGLLDAFARYLNFVVDFLAARGMQSYAKLSSVNSDLATFFVFGLTLAYLISRARTIPTYASITDGGVQSGFSDADGAKNDSYNVLLNCFLFVGIGILFHIVLRVYFALVFPAVRLSLKDSINAILGFNAVYVPIDALIRVLTREDVIQYVGNVASYQTRQFNRRGCLFVVIAMLRVASFAYLLAIGYEIYAFSAVHQLPFSELIIPFIIWIILVGVPALWALSLLRPASQFPKPTTPTSADNRRIY